MSNERAKMKRGGNIPRFRREDLFQFGKALLISAGLPEDMACDVAEVLLEGDLLGHATHGFALLPLYLKSLAEGGMEKRGGRNSFLIAVPRLPGTDIICRGHGWCGGRLRSRRSEQRRIRSSQSPSANRITSAVYRHI